MTDLTLKAGWTRTILRSHTTKIGSGITPKGGSKVYLRQGITLIRSHNVLVNELSLKDAVFISATQHESMYSSRVLPRDVLLNITGASIGRSCVVPDGIGQANVNQHVCIIRCNKQLDPFFLCQFINSSLGQKQIFSFQAGGNREGLNYDQIGRFNIPFPPIHIQKAIAQTLDGWDRAIGKLQALIAAKTQYKRGLMQQLLTGRKRFAEFFSSDEKQSLQVGSFPKDWKFFRLAEVIQEVRRKNTSGVDRVLTASGNHGLIDQQDYFNRSVAGKSLEGYYLLQRGEFAYNRSLMKGYPYGAIKRLDAYDEGIVSILYLCFRISSDECDSNWLAHVFESGILNAQLRSIAKVGARAHGLLNVASAEFFDMILAVPSRQEQEKIASVLDAADKEIDLLQQQLTALKKQKQGLMQKLLTGQIRVKVDGETLSAEQKN